MQRINGLIAAVIIFIAATACKKQNYTSGGSIVSPQVNVSTYDFLKSDTSHHFDTVALLIDKAGLTDVINEQNITFFSPTNFSIRSYIADRALEEFSLDPTHT